MRIVVLFVLKTWIHIFGEKKQWIYILSLCDLKYPVYWYLLKKVWEFIIH